MSDPCLRVGTAQLNEERTARQRAEGSLQERERQMSMLNVDYKNIQQRLQKLEGEYRQEVEKVRDIGRTVQTIPNSCTDYALTSPLSPDSGDRRDFVTMTFSSGNFSGFPDVTRRNQLRQSS